MGTRDTFTDAYIRICMEREIETFVELDEALAATRDPWLDAAVAEAEGWKRGRGEKYSAPMGRCTHGEENRMRRAEIEQLAEGIAALLSKIEGGEMVATPAMRYRLEGALVALRAVLGDASDALEILSQ